MSQSTARVRVIADFMLEHSEGFLLVENVGRRKSKGGAMNTDAS